MRGEFKKTCIRCGVKIINGINGCQLMKECFDCHGGFPKYPAPTVKESVGWDELDALEDRCVRDWEE